MQELHKFENKLGAKTEKAEFNGSYGFVIKPDPLTIQKAKSLAKQMSPSAEYQTIFPHVTLFHAQLESLPLKDIKEILSELVKYEGINLTFNSIEIFGDKFLFWNIEKTDQLLSMHRQALGIAKYLNKDTVAKAKEEGLKMTTEELENIKRYGHPLVLDRFTPHITLAYDSRGIKLPKNTKPQSWNMKVEKIVFAEIGKYGSVQRTIDL